MTYYDKSEKIELNKDYLSIQTAFARVAERDMSKADRKEFERSRVLNAQLAYKEIKEEFLADYDFTKFVTNVSANSDLVIKTCFDDSDFLNSLKPAALKKLVINCFIHEGHNVPRCRQRMRTIVRKYPDMFSDEILAEFEK